MNTDYAASLSQGNYHFHEMKNLAAVLQGLLQLLSLDPKYSADRQKLQLMYEEMERLHRMLAAYTTLLKENHLCPERLCVKELLTETASLLSGLAALQKVRIRLRISGSPEIFGEAFLVRQMLLNFGKNAIEAMPNGGTLTFEARIESGHSLLFVEDEGGGISSALLAQLEAEKESTKELGNGIGLSFCKYVWEQCRAVCSAEATAKGTRFCLLFPAVETAELEAEA